MAHGYQSVHRLLFTINLGLRMGREAGAVLPLILSLMGVAKLGMSGWLGSELVYCAGWSRRQQRRLE